jgi:hypothetical protein
MNFGVIIYACWIVFALYWILSSRSVKSAAKRQSWVGTNALNLIENARSSHEFHECHETLSLSVAPLLALFVYFVQFVAVLVLPKQEFHLKLMALGRNPGAQGARRTWLYAAACAQSAGIRPRGCNVGCGLLWCRSYFNLVLWQGLAATPQARGVLMNPCCAVPFLPRMAPTASQPVTS